MKVSTKIRCLLVTVIIGASILTGCAIHPTVGQEISGEWQVVDSSSRFKISFVDGDIRIEGWDSNDRERFRISNVEWDGTRLRGTFVMPSTGHTTYSDLLLIDRNTLKGSYKGDASGEEVWKRQWTSFYSVWCMYHIRI